jgi:Flp pilus assembly protein TadD
MSLRDCFRKFHGLLRGGADGASGKSDGRPDCAEGGDLSVRREAARQLFANREHVKARALYEELAREIPGCEELHVELIGVLFALGDMGAVGRVLDRAETLHPNSPALRELRAQRLLRIGDHEGAAREFRELVEAAPDNVKLRLGLVQALLAGGNLNGAEAACSAARESFPKNPALLSRAGQIALARGDHARAVALFQATGTRRKSPSEYREFADSLGKAGRIEEAETVFREALDAHRDDPVLGKAYLEFLLGQGKHDAYVEYVLGALQSGNRKNIWILGNCQAAPLSFMLNAEQCFSSQYRCVDLIPPIHRQPVALQQLILDEVVPRIDYVFTQDILNEAFPLRTDSLKDKTNRITVFPTCHFAAYHPDIMSLKQSGRTVMEPLSVSYHSCVVLHSFFNDRSESECAERLRRGDWFTGEYDVFVESVFQELRERESRWDIKLTRLLADRFEREILFHTVNHPKAEILHEIASSMMSRLGLPGLSDATRDATGHMLSQTRWNVSERTRRRFSLPGAREAEEIVIGNRPMSAEEFVRIYYDLNRAEGPH